MKKKLVVLSAFGMFFSAANGMCEDEIVIDLSVLGEVSSSPSISNSTPAFYAPQAAENVSVPPVSAKISQPQGSVSSYIDLPPVEPKFPVVKSPAVKKENKPKKVEKPVSKKEPVKMVKTNADKKTDTPVKEVEIVQEKKAISANVPPISLSPVHEPIRVEVVDIKEIAEDFGLNKEESEQLEKKIVGKTEIESEEKTVETKEEKTTRVNVLSVSEANIIQDKKIEDSVEALNDVIKSGKSISVKEVIEEAAEKEKADALQNSIYFPEDETELTEGQKNEIKKIVSTFENPAKNRLIIFSYALDGTEDLSKKRLQSVTRAGEVRKYLISLGYKNSGMKIMNVAEITGKANTVEIIELK